MIDKINKQFQILSAEAKRFLKISQSYTLQSTLFSSFLAALKSVLMISSNISNTFIELLTQDQIKVLFKNSEMLINHITQKMSELNTKVSQINKQKQNKITKGNSQNCSICGENIHESNIKQAKIFLEEQSRQNFQLAMEQFKRIAEEPIHTKEQNNQFEQKLYFQLSQRQRVLNINCNRIEEYVEVMEGALEDLTKIKQIQLNQNQIPNVQFINMNKINEDVSLFLQNSFSKKIPPWIHKMFARMMAIYIEMCKQKKIQKSTQTTVYQALSSKQLREQIKQKRQLQKQNRQISNELKELKICYKKLQQINNQYVITIASMSKNTKYRSPQSYKEPKSRRNSKHTNKGEKQKQQNKDQPEQIEKSNYHDDSDISDEINITKKKSNRLFPQIKKIKNDNIPQKKSNKVQIAQIKRQNKSNDKNTNGRLTQRSKQITSMKKISEEVVEAKKEDNQKKKKKQKDQKGQQNIKYQTGKKKQNKIKKNLLKSKQNQKEKQKENQKENQKEKQRDIQRQTQKQSKKEKFSNIIKEKSRKNNQKGTGLKPLDITNNNIDKNSSLVDKQGQDQMHELYEYISHITLKQKNRQHNQKQKEYKEYKEQKEYKDYKDYKEYKGHSNNLEELRDIKTYKQKGIQCSDQKGMLKTLKDYNKLNNSKQLAVIKKVSQDLSKKIKIKKSSLYSSFDAVNQDPGRVSLTNLTNQNIEIVNTQTHEMDIGHSNKMERIKNQFKSKHSSRYQETNKQNYREYINNYKQNKEVHQGSQSLERESSSQLHQKSVGYQKTEDIRSKKRKQLQNSFKKLKNTDKNMNLEAKQMQRKIFQILKSNQMLPKQVDFNFFNVLIQGIPLQRSNYHQSHSLNNFSEIKRQNSQRKQDQVGEILQESTQQQAHNSVYGRLFLNKAVAYKYQQSMAKNYHKRVLKELNEAQRDYCYQMYSDLCEAKKIVRETYHQFCSILRYPYQTLYNNFQVVNFMTDMSFDTFEYFFRKIVWIHRKCIKSQGIGVCLHISSVSEQLKEILELKK